MSDQTEDIILLDDSDNTVLLSSLLQRSRDASIQMVGSGSFMSGRGKTLVNGNGLFDDLDNTVTLLIDAIFHVVTGGPGTALTISDVTVEKSATSAIVSWTTDVPSNSRVNYGITSLYGLSESDSELVTSHSITLSGLDPSTIYHFSVFSVSAVGDSDQSSDSTFETLASGGVVAASDIMDSIIDLVRR